MRKLRDRYILVTVLSYVVLALLWVLMSDYLLSAFTTMESMHWYSTAKGVFFVFASALALFFALRAVPTDPNNHQGRLQEVIFSGTFISRRPTWITYSFAVLISLVMLLVRHHMGLNTDHRPLMIFIHVSHHFRCAVRRVLARRYFNSYCGNRRKTIVYPHTMELSIYGWLRFIAMEFSDC